MRYLSICSGIEAATVAWGPLGWQAVAFAEVERFPSAVLAYHYPDVPNLGDMTKINGADFRGKIDVLVGGTPCQSFSVAGLRGGLDDERGNLALEFVRLADESDPAFVLWENVPGVLSDRGNAFGCFLAALAGEGASLLPPGGRWTDAGYVLGPRRSIAWRVLDAQYFGLAQRRRRVFLVGCPRNGADPREILFESEGLRRDTPPSRETGKSLAGTLEAGIGRSRGSGTPPGAITQALTGRLGGGGPDDNKAQGGFYVPEIVSQAISCKWSKGTSGPAGDEHHNLVANTLCAEGFDASEDGTGRQNLVVQDIAGTLGGGSGNRGYANSPDICGAFIPVAFAQNTRDEIRLQGGDGSICGALGAQEGMKQRTYVALPIAFHGSQDPDVSGDVTHPVGRNQGQETCVMAFTERGRKGGRTLEAQSDLAYALTNPGSGGRTHSRQIFDARSAVRRLTPRECERLQGFPDDYTLIPWRGKPASECPDGPRYKALGNSMAAPVMRWIGERIESFA